MTIKDDHPIACRCEACDEYQTRRELSMDKLELAGTVSEAVDLIEGAEASLEDLDVMVALWFNSHVNWADVEQYV